MIEWLRQCCTDTSLKSYSFKAMPLSALGIHSFCKEGRTQALHSRLNRDLSVL